MRWRGIILVFIGSCSYGLLATFTRLAYGEGYTTAEVTFSQFVLGFTTLALLSLCIRPPQQATFPPAARRKLFFAGTMLGFTGLTYYLSVLYVPVSVAIVLLMQSTWMGVLLEAILTRKVPSTLKIIATLVVWVGTFLAAGIMETSGEIPDIRGVVFGLLAAAGYTASVYVAGRVATGVYYLWRSTAMVGGGLLLVSLWALPQWVQTGFDTGILFRWGVLLALFGTVLPPLLFAKGVPLTGVGLASILGAAELPVSVIMAWWWLSETVTPLRWTGVALILFAVVLMNIPNLRSIRLRVPEKSSG